MIQNKKTIGLLLNEAKKELKKRQLDLNAAEILLETRLEITRSELWGVLNQPLEDSLHAQFQSDFTRYLQGEPVQYILNKAPFYGLDFYVDRDVLIPRLETEELVLLTEKAIKKIGFQKVADICTGSGVIAITLKKLFPQAEIVATDISSKALKVAHKNAARLQANVLFKKMNLIDGFIETGEKFPVVVANPPYIARREKKQMSPYITNHEPAIALFADREGLAIYEELIQKLPFITAENYFLAVEIGHTQGKSVKALFRKNFPEAEIVIHKDINQKERIVSCTNVDI